ncbi:unnamed protein product [Calypogeia fissa]
MATAMDRQLRMKRVQQKFKMRGLTLTLDAVKAVLKHVEESDSSEDEALNLVLAEMDKVSLKSNMLSKDAILEVLGSLAGNFVNEQNQLCIVDAFNVPRFCYDSIRKSFYRYTQKQSIHGEAQSKAALYRDRFQLLQQRVIRDKHFAKPAFGLAGSRTGACEMIPLQSLLGSVGHQWVMGTISQVEDGRFCLEDLTASVPIDFSEAISSSRWKSYFVHVYSGFFTENCVVVAEGDLQPNGVFKIHTLGFPPLESRGLSLSVTAGHDFFGAGALNFDEIARLEQREKNATNYMFVILSEIWLDHEETMQKLSQVLTGFEQVDVVPSLFIFMGNFCSHPCNLAFNRFSELRSHFGRLGSMISDCPRIKQSSRFLFIPGPEDVGSANVLPRPPLPKYFTDEILKYIPNAEFGSNPCRIRFYAQEIVLIREDLICRMRRSCIITPSEEETKDPFEHLVATVTHQSHLCPLPLTVQPISWPYDHSLRLYPTPQTIVLADRLEQKVFKYAGVTSFSPGSFSSDGAFIAYRPATSEPELSSI